MNIVVACLLFFMTPTIAFAYIDPVTGSMAIQALIAIVAGAIVAFRMYYRRAKHWVLSLLGKQPPPEKSDKALPQDNEPTEPK